MDGWEPFFGALSLRRIDVPPRVGPLAELGCSTVVAHVDGALVVLSASLGMTAEVTARLQDLADELAQAAAAAAPTDVINGIRDGVRAAVDGGRFGRGLPEILAAVVDPAFGLRLWRAGANAIGSAGRAGVRLVSEDLRFAALRRRGVELPGAPRDPLVEEVSALLQLDPPHDAPQRMAVRMEGGCILLLSRGAMPFGAPNVGEPGAAFWARDAGWRHGMGAVVLAIADAGARPAADLAMDACEDALVTAMRVGREDGNVLLRVLHRAATRLAEGSAEERFATARWAADLPDGRDLLAFVASDASADPSARQAAIDALASVGVGGPTGRTVPVTADVDLDYYVARTFVLDAARARSDATALLMETRYPQGVHTLACTAAGQVQSLYSTGLLETDWGKHATIRAAAAAFRRSARPFERQATPTWDLNLPADGIVRFLFVSPRSVRALDAVEITARHDGDPLSPLYHAAHGVLTAMRLVEERGGSDEPVVEVAAHALFDHDPQSELDLLEELQAEAPAYIPTLRFRLGGAFRDALRILGYRFALGRERTEIIAALRSIVEIGVALFDRGKVGPDVTVRLAVLGATLDVAGGVDDSYSPPNWISAASAAIVLRDDAAIDSLCAVNPAAFEGTRGSDAYVELHARALMALHRGDPDAAELFEAAVHAAEHATSSPELGERVAAPCLRTMLAVIAEDPDAYRARLVDGLDAYRSVYQRPDFNHQTSNLVPLRYLAVCALAFDRGLACPVRSSYVPHWLVEGDLGAGESPAPRVADERSDVPIERLRDVRIADARFAGTRLALSMENVDLRGASLAGASPSLWALRCSFDDADATAARWPHARLQHCTANRARFDGADITAADAKELRAEGASFANVSAEGSDWSGAKLRGSSFRSAVLRGARFEHADLREVDLQGADLRGAWLVGADLSGANTEGAMFDGAEPRSTRGLTRGG